jgi:hypothetical protein
MLTAILLLLLVVFLLLVILLLLLKLRKQASGSGTGSTPQIPDQITGPALASYLRTRIAGTPADGSAPAAVTQNTVVWVDRGDEVLVDLGSLTTQVVNETVLVSLDLECDQTGKTPLVVAFSLGTDAQGGLIAATDEFPRGNGALAARWGSAVQAAAWSALLALATDHATERNLSPLALSIQNGNIQLVAGPPLKIA